jgi:Mg/Co/Ni transporter MgtE
MTTNLVVVPPDQTVGAVRDILRAQQDHAGDLDSVVVINPEGQLIGDVPLYSIAIATKGKRIGSLLPPGEAVSVLADAGITEVAERLVETRHSSVVVVDADGRPIGRILADDLLDALMPERGRHHFPRFLT